MDSSQNESFTADADAVNIIPTEEDENECQHTITDADPVLVPSVSFFALFRFASCMDGFLIFLSALISIIAGFVTPIMLNLFGDAMNAFVNGGSLANATNCTDWYLENAPHLLYGKEEEDPMKEFIKFSFYVALVAASRFVLTFFFYSSLNYTAEKQVYKIRSRFLEAVLRQDISWYDTATSNDFASRITEDLNKIQEGIGSNIGILLSCISVALSCFGTAFYHGWELTLVMLAAMPLVTITTGVVTRIQASLAEAELKAYAKSGGVAEEVLSSIRTVMAFGGQQKEIERYERSLSFAQKAGIKRGTVTGIGAGLNTAINYASYALVFWYGMNLILKSCDTNSGYTVGDIVTIFFCVLVGSTRLGRTSPYFEAISVAKGAGASIFSIINRVPAIDSSSDSGIKLDYIMGDLSFESVRFNYPSRPDVKVLKDLKFKVPAGQTVALVGTSGSGKSTCIQLLQRFYDPQEGKVCIDGYDIRDLNIGWLRAQIGMVGQEPVLFGTTIGENIRYGRDGVTQEEIEAAAKEANAHDFISRLPLKYDTMVGERGAQLSGGQKQRIAIARALVRNPKILLLDEATSALDTQSEAVVQRALDKARLGRTTIIVAHRLSTIRNADRIIVIKEGIVEEEGTHKTLMEKQGSYYELVVSQGCTGKNDTISKDGTMKSDSSDLTPIPSESEIQDTLDIKESNTSVGFTESSSSSLESALLINSESDKEEEEESPNQSSMMDILRLNKREWPIIFMGVIGSTIVGLSTPAYAILFAQVMSVLTPGGTAEDQIEKRAQGDFYSLLFLLLGLVVGLADFAQKFCYTVAGEALTSRIRTLAFQSILRKETAWFDREENSVGSLCVRLSGDAANVKGATGPRIGIVCEAVSTMVVSIVISLYYEWRLGLLALSFTPLSILFVYLNGKVIQKQSSLERISLQQSAKVAIEAIGNIRTVASLGKEKEFHDRFMNALQDSHKKALQNYWIGGLVFGFSNSITMFTYAATFYYGGWLFTYDGLDYRKVIAVTEALIMGTSYIGQAFALVPSYHKAKVAADRIFALIHSTPNHAILCKDKYIEDVTGRIDFDQVEFQYPNRKDTKVLQGLSLSVKAGQNVALVGQSGCGKSTCIQLLERFYDPDAGQVMLDGQNIRSVNIDSLRSHMSIVSQEPVLFNRTIGENIAYGDNSREVPMDEIIESARKSNIHSFIQSLPNGYDTMVGERGTQLSGGQKQRVAIARALVRNPKILLLDEATSALDSESERVVQTALDAAQEGRTCITIAHRLSTIKNSDVIYVINNGKIKEQGTHDDLIKRNGLYAELCSLQGVSETHRDDIPLVIL